ncbi:MAG: response regulator transcription factor [Dehalococcoidia bacterium]
MRPRDHLLVVDDDPSIRCTLADLFMEEGYEVLQARNGAEALAVALHTSPCAIILDLNMPVMDGAEFYRELRARGIGAPVVIVSAVNAIRAARELGAAAGLNKPFDLDEVVETVDALVRAPGG